jgi:hypothetical protein
VDIGTIILAVIFVLLLSLISYFVVYKHIIAGGGGVGLGVGGLPGAALAAGVVNIVGSGLLLVIFFSVTRLSPGLANLSLGPYGLLYILEILSVLGVLCISLIIMHVRGGWDLVLFGASGSPIVTGSYSGGEGVIGTYLVVAANDVVDYIREKL